MIQAPKSRMMILALMFLGVAPGTKAQTPYPSQAEAISQINRRHLVVGEVSRLAAAESKIARLWGNNQKIAMPYTLGDYKTRPSPCAEEMEEGLQHADSELSSLTELLDISDMQTDYDQRAVSGLVWLHALSTEGALRILSAVTSRSAKQCTSDSLIIHETGELSSWLKEATPLVNKIKSEAAQLSGHLN